MSALIPFDNANEYRTTALKRVEGKDLSGQVFVVTGASGALGQELLLALASAGGTVVAAGRSMKKLQEAKDSVLERASKSSIAMKGEIACLAELDLGDLDSVSSFAAAVKEKYNQKVNVLINNAGMVPSASGYRESKYGTEATFQANFVSTVVLTEMILPLMAQGEKSRVIHVSSMSHADASKPINWDVIPSTKETYGGYNKDYCESKWLLTAYMSALQKRLDTKKSSTISMCADPGISPNSAMWDEQTMMMRVLARYVFRFLTKTSPQAAGCAAHLAVMDDATGGGYYNSGTLYPPMRDDCQDPEEWKKMVAVLKKALPSEYQKYAVDVE